MLEILRTKRHMISKLFIYQFAMSLLGLFVVSPFKGTVQIAASVFAVLFYYSLVCYAVIEDGQKDFVSHTAGRIAGKWYTGLVYSLVSYLPTIVIVLFQSIISLLTSPATLGSLKAIINVIIRFFLMGMYLGIDTGLINRTEDPTTHLLVSDAPEWLVFLSENSLIFAILLIVMPVVCAISYNLAFKGKIHVDTSEKKKK